MNLFVIIAKGGWLMIAIGICSVIAIAIFIERLIVLHRSSVDTKTFIYEIKGTIGKSGIDEAKVLCGRMKVPIASLVKAGLELKDRSKQEIRTAVENAGKVEVHKLEKNLGILGTIAAIAPLIGFLGTVTGMIKAFMKIQVLGGNVNASVLAGGIWEALVTTAAGLAVGIPALIFYNYLVSKVDSFVLDMETNSEDILNLLKE